MEYKIENNKLIGKDIDFKLSPNSGSKFKKTNLDTVIIHFTAGSNRLSSVNSLCSSSSKASAHLVIGRDEKITQLIPFDTIAWHAGESSYEGRAGFNKYSIGIEIDNAGLLKKSGDLYTSWFGKDYKLEEVLEAKHKNRFQNEFWHKYTEWQIESCFEICKLLIEEYDIKYILGHDEISPTRKIDPGPAFPIEKFRDRLLNQDRSIDGPEVIKIDDKATVNVDNLNIREKPSVNSQKIAQPLVKGQELIILEIDDDWVRVKTEITGWVNKKFLINKSKI